MAFRVLIVDDEPTICRALSRVIRALEYEVATASDAEAAYQLLHEQHFDAVLLDMRLGSTMGDALYFAITRQWPHLLGRIVLMSGATTPPVGEWPAELEHCPFLLKPFALDAVMRSLTSVLANPARPRHGTA